MRLSKLKKYVFYLTALMPFIILFVNVVYFSFTHQILEQVPESLGYDLFNEFIYVCDSFIPNFVDLGEIIYSIFSPEGIWGDCLVSYFTYFVAIVLYNLLINIILFFVYIFDSWVKKYEEKI